MSKTVLFQTIQSSISTQISFIWLIDRTLSGPTISGNGNKEVLHIPHITETKPSGRLESFPGHSLGDLTRCNLQLQMTGQREYKMTILKQRTSFTYNEVPKRSSPVGWDLEYTDYISAEGYDFPQRVSWYDTKQSDGTVSVMLELWWMWSSSSLAEW